MSAPRSRALVRAIALVLILWMIALPALADPPPDYAPPVKIEETNFFRIHRYDLEGLVADRQALAGLRIDLATCKGDLSTCYQQRTSDAINPNADVWPLWTKAVIYTVGTIAIGVAGKLTGDWITK